MPSITAKEVDIMLSGELIKLLDMLQEKHLPKHAIWPARNDQGCGLIDDAAASGGELKRVDQAKREQR